MPVTRIVLSGGPAAGKSSVLPFLRSTLEGEGRKVFVLNEAASLWMDTGAKRPNANSEGTVSWSAALFRFQRALEDSVLDYADTWEKETGDEVYVLLDRSLLDSISYQTDDSPEWYQFAKLALPDLRASSRHPPRREVAVTMLASRYDVVLFLPSLAVVSPQVYEKVSASNPHRRETAAQASATNEAIRTVAARHEHFIEVSPDLLKPALDLPLAESLSHLQEKVREVVEKKLTSMDAWPKSEPQRKRQRK